METSKETIMYFGNLTKAVILAVLMFAGSAIFTQAASAQDRREPDRRSERRDREAERRDHDREAERRKHRRNHDAERREHRRDRQARDHRRHNPRRR
jgi:hypothetical protein